MSRLTFDSLSFTASVASSVPMHKIASDAVIVHSVAYSVPPLRSAFGVVGRSSYILHK